MATLLGVVHSDELIEAFGQFLDVIRRNKWTTAQEIMDPCFVA
jgi:hypothetical protein